MLIHTLILSHISNSPQQKNQSKQKFIKLLKKNHRYKIVLKSKKKGHQENKLMCRHSNICINICKY